MQEKIHPKYYPEAVVSCACGETFKTGSTLPTIRIEICSKCHPFFTGKEKIMDRAGRIEKFQKKHANVEIGAAPKKKAPKARKEKAE